MKRFLLFLLTAPLFGATYFVATTGSDSNSGTYASPFLTIQKGANVVAAGDTVYVMDGTYNQSCATTADNQVLITTAGTATARITFKSFNRGGAILDSQLLCAYNFRVGVFSGGVSLDSYVTIDGFDMKDGITGGIFVVGNNITVTHCLIHNQGNQSDTSTSGGHVGVLALNTQSGALIDGNLFHDIGRTNVNCPSSPCTSRDQNLYLEGSGVAINNIFYNLKLGWAIALKVATGWVISNNTIYGPNALSTVPGQIVIGDNTSSIVSGTSTIQNNLFINPTTSGVVTCGANITGTIAIDHNDTFGSGVTGTLGADFCTASTGLGNITTASNINADPLFTAPGSQDFHIPRTSPAVNAGVTISQATIDYTGVGRPQDTTYDLGAYELSANGWTDHTNTHLLTQAIPSVGGGSPVWGAAQGGTDGCPPNSWQPAGGGMPVYPFHDECHDKINNSNGGALDTKRNRLCVFGGGHQRYQGNEVYCYDLNASPVKVLAITNPSIFDPVNCPEANADGTPLASHTYGGMVYLPEIDRYFMQGGPSVCGPALEHTWMWNPGDQTVRNGWTDTAASPSIVVYGTHAYSTDGVRCFRNDTRQTVDCEFGNNNMWMEYHYMPSDPLYNGWYKLTNFSTYCTGVTGCVAQQSLTFQYDPIRKQAWAFGGNASPSGGPPGTFLAFYTDFSTGSDYITHAPVTTGCTGLMIQQGEYPGVAYDPARRGFSIFPGTGNTVWFFNPTTRQCTSHTFTSGPTVTANTTADGTFGRFVFSPSFNNYNVVTGVDNDLFSFVLDNTPVAGLGSCSTTTFIDKDCDGYGVGQLKVGPFSDGIIGASNTFSSASHNFTVLDVGRHVPITAGTNCTVGDYMISSTASNIATLATSPGTVGSSCSWSMDGTLGPDADDLDASVNTTATALAKWTTVTGWLNHLGYADTHIWYMAPASASPAGNDSTCLVDRVDLPCLTYAHVNGLVRPNDALIMRDNWSGIVTPNRSIDGNPGTSGNPYFFLSYPGEQAVFDPTIIASSKFTLTDCPWIVVDNVTLQNGGVLTGGTTDPSATFAVTEVVGGVTIQSRVAHRLMRNIHGMGGGDGLGVISAFNGLLDFNLESSVLHQAGSGNQHNSYIGSRNFPSATIPYLWNIAFNAAQAGNNFHFNGRMYNVEVRGNLLYNSAIANLSPQQGISHSYIVDNVMFGNNGGALDLDTYPGSQLSPCSPNSPGGNGCNCGTDGLQVCTCPNSSVNPGPQLARDVCPNDEVDNLIENNTIYETGTNPCGTATCTTGIASLNQPAIVMFNQSYNATINLSAILRNNHIINYGNNNGQAPIHLSDTNGTSACGTKCLSWAAASSFDHNIFYQTSSPHGTKVLRLGGSGGTDYDCSTMTAQVLSNINCINSDPLFLSATAAQWNQPSAQNFHLAISSPGTHAGTQTGVPLFDKTGLSFNIPTPSIGALEFVPTVCNITTNSPLPNGTVGIAYSQTLAFVGCAAPVTWDLFSGSLPGWAALGSSSGIISGNPNAAATTSFTVRLTDNVGNIDTQALSITIQAAGNGGCITRGPIAKKGPVACK